MTKQKRMKTKSGLDVDMTMEVVNGREVHFVADDPSDPSKKLEHRITIGAINQPAVNFDTPQKAQATIDAEAEKFAELVESRKQVAELLANVT